MTRVIAAPGLRVPREDNPRTYIESTPADVPDSTYYRRRLANGELLVAEPVAASADKPTIQASKGSKA